MHWLDVSPTRREFGLRRDPASPALARYCCLSTYGYAIARCAPPRLYWLALDFASASTRRYSVERIVEAAQVLVEVTLLHQVAGQLVPVAEAAGEDLVLAQVLARLVEVADAAIGDGQVEQHRLGVVLGARALVQALRGEHVGNGARLLAQQRTHAATRAESVGQQPVVLALARERDAGFVIGQQCPSVVPSCPCAAARQ